MKKVLITGGGGLIGKSLAFRLMENGYRVSILSRSGTGGNGIKVYHWNPERNEIDPEALENVSCIVHLAGVNIGGRRWTAGRKKQIIDSRVRTGELILDALKQKGGEPPGVFISASATGFYGAVTDDQIYIESDPPAGDFLGQTCRRWEAVADRFSELGVRSVKIRTGVVLSENGGMLSRLHLLIRMGLGTGLGTGRQFLSWIHMQDLCNIYLRALENNTMEGAYNAVAPEYDTNREFMRVLARSMNRPFWLPNIPSLFLRVIFGEMSVMLLKGSRVSPDRILSAGYRFTYPDLKSALEKIYG